MDYLSVILSGVGVNEPPSNSLSNSLSNPLKPLSNPLKSLSNPPPLKENRFRPYDKNPRIRIVFLKDLRKPKEEKTYAICPVCDSIVPSKERSVHILENHSDKLCVCINCNAKIIYTPLYPHYHNKKKGCICITCMREARDNRYCKACNKIFLDESNFKRHLKKHK